MPASPPPPPGRPRRGTARERTAAFRAAERRARRRRLVLIWSATALAIIAATTAIGVAVSSAGSQHASATHSTDTATSVLTGPTGPEGIVLEQGQPLAPASTGADGQTIDGVECNASEQVAYHIHAHLSVYVNGTLRPIPAGIGIVAPAAEQTPNGEFDSATRCYYWLHVHAQDGVIHVESPNQTTHTLGQLFAIWKQPLNTDAVGPATGTVTAFVNGAPFTGDPAAIPLRPHEDIQIDVGTPPVAPLKVDWSASQL